MMKGQGDRLVQPQKEMTKRGPHQRVEVSGERVPGGWIQALLGSTKQQHKRQWAQTDAQKFHLNVKKNFFTVQ